MNTLIILLITISFISFIWLVIELIIISVLNLPLFKEIDLNETELNPIDNKILSFLGSKLKGKYDYITNTPIPILFPYYISLNNYKNKKTIMRFSKNYFLIKNKFKELNK